MSAPTDEHAQDAADAESPRAPDPPSAGDNRRDARIRLLTFLWHPTAVRAAVTFVLTAFVTGVCVPYITNGWQDHEKELDLKIGVVNQISAAVATLMVAIEGQEYLQETTAYRNALKPWEIKSQEIGSTLNAYFPPGDGRAVADDWNVYMDLVNHLYNLGDCTNGAPLRSQDFSALKADILTLSGHSERLFGDTRMAVFQSAPLGKWKGWAALRQCPSAKDLTVNGIDKGGSYSRYWLQLRELVLAGKNVINREIVETPVPIYTHLFNL